MSNYDLLPAFSQGQVHSAVAKTTLTQSANWGPDSTGVKNPRDEPQALKQAGIAGVTRCGIWYKEQTQFTHYMNLCWPHTYSMKTNRELSYGQHTSQSDSKHRIALFEFHFLLEAQIKCFWGLSKTVSYNCLDMIFNGYCGLKIFFHEACKPVTSMKIMFHNQSVIMCKNISLKHKKIPT